MSRRKFLKSGAGAATAAVAGAGLITSAPAISQGREKLVMVTTWGRGLAGVFDAAQRVADTVNTLSDGTLEIEIKAQGELVTGLPAVFDAVTSGQADMYHGADYYWVGQHPAWAFFTAVPFGMTANELNNWYYQMGGHELHREIGEEFGLVPFLAGNTGAQGGGWFREPIRSADDFRGLKFRMPGLGGAALGKLGASVQTIAGGEIYQALSSGALDGTEWIGPWADEKMGLQEITKNFYPAGFHEPGAGLTTAVNIDRWDKLSPVHQKTIEIAAAEANLWSLTQFLSNNATALDRLIAGGVQSLEFPPDVWDAFGKASRETLDENMDDELFAKVRESVAESQRLSSRWAGLSDGYYTAQRDRVLG